MAITQFQPQNQDQNQNLSQAPILGQSTGTFGQGMASGQRTVSPQTKGSGRFTNLQSYLQANEPTSGELNPNARLIQQRVQQAQTGAQAGLGQFQTAQTQAQKGLEGIRERGQLVESAFKSPEEFIKQTPQLERFTALRTGTENIPTTQSFLNPLEQSQQQLQSTRQNIATGLQTDITGGGLQEYLRQQRLKPELATRGETQLDRFIAEQTPGGISQLEAGRLQAESLRALQPESIASQQQLATQIGQMPFISQSAIQNELSKIRQEQEQFITNLNQEQAKNYIAQSLNGTAQSYEENLNELNRSIRKIQQAIAQRDRNIANIPNLPEYRQEVDDLDRMIFADPRAGNERWVRETRAKGMEELRNKYINKVDLGRYEGERYLNEIANNPETQKLRTYESAVNNLQNLNRRQLLQQYDPTRLARIQALGVLGGQGYEDFLSRGIT